MTWVSKALGALRGALCEFCGVFCGLIILALRFVPFGLGSVLAIMIGVGLDFAFATVLGPWAFLLLVPALLVFLSYYTIEVFCEAGNVVRFGGLLVVAGFIAGSLTRLLPLIIGSLVY